MGNSVEQHLAELARAAFATLDRASQDIAVVPYGHTIGLMATVLGNPAHGEFVRSVLEDPELSRLFPGSGPAGWQGGIMGSAGSGTLLQVELLAQALIGSAYAWARNETISPQIASPKGLSTTSAASAV